ncbi:prepilin peptidase [Bacillus sp. CGMCC 1.16607]|uniref:prepilin peptidase n=1 Tax=Bacillus sp. CGMCC 1.16607 TaxID=3351842 RepID=UPI0036402679
MILYIFVLFYGLFLGSFYNVVGLRIPANQSIVKPRSACPNCKHTLGPLELIPVLSYVFQRGKCRVCKTGISPLYPIMELLTGLLFLAAPFILGWTYELWIAWTLISLFIIITVSDLAYMLIPDKILLFFAGIFIIERFLIPLTPWWDSLLGAAIGFILLLIIAVVSKGGMGGGDIKLYTVIGFVIGSKLLLLSFFLATLIGAIFGIIGLALGILERKKPMPFGPFIAIGALLAYFYGDTFISTYLQLMTFEW